MNQHSIYSWTVYLTWPVYNRSVKKLTLKIYMFVKIVKCTVIFMLKMYTTKDIISYATKNYTINVWTTPIVLNPFIQVMYGPMASHSVKLRFHFHTEVESWIGSGNPILPETYPTGDKRVELTLYPFVADRIRDRLTLNVSCWFFLTLSGRIGVTLF